VQQPSHASPGILTRRRRVLLGSLLACSSLFLIALWQPGRLTSAATLPDLLDSVLQRATNSLRGPVRVGLQVGHLDVAKHPDELANLRFNTGGHWAGVNEVDLNLAVAQHLKTSLELDGILVDLLPATLPPGYRADLLISIHADANPDTTRRGYKSAHFVNDRYPEGRNALEPLLKAHLDAAYFYYSGLPDDDMNVSGAMLQYYAFNHRRFRHSVHPRTPAVIVELGYLSSSEDMRFLRDPVNPAYALKRGIVSYLTEQGRLGTTLAER
jgi:hypothetical protein